MSTRLRAYKLGSEGSSYSYYDGNIFTLFEGRLNDFNAGSINHELQKCGKGSVDVLHITSWDRDHCKLDELEKILERLSPTWIEAPGYKPHTQNGIDCLSLLEGKYASIERIGPSFISGLTGAVLNGPVNDILYWPIRSMPKSNDMSIVKWFRRGDFNVLSTGDVECDEALKYITSGRLNKGSVDVLILPHHGSVHSITKPALLDHIDSRVAICTSDRGNKFNHPYVEVTNMLSARGIGYYSTKDGDVIVESNESGTYTVYNYSKNESTGKVTKSSQRIYEPH